MDIAAWLRSLGLERHEEAFRANEIDWEVLPELSEADLEKLGLLLGPRKKLLKAIAGLSEGTGPAAASPALAAPWATSEAERRQLTVMFCDLVGSTALSERLDAEELGDLIRAYHERVSAEVGRFEGHVAKYLGDGVLAYFGWPRAHEDDAERAIRAGLAFLALALWLSGFPDQASRTIDRALGVLEGLDHANSRGYVLVWGAATLAQLRRDGVALPKHVDEVVSLAREHGLGLWLAYGKVFRGWVLAEQGRQEEGRAELARALAECQATRTRMHRPYHLSLLAGALHRSGRSEEGLQAVEEALAVVEETGERWWEADLHRLRGDLLLSLSTQNAAGAEAEYDTAVTTARRQGARMLELRAATSLARLWRARGGDAEARDLLAPVYAWFAEGLDTPDLRDAGALLEELSCSCSPSSRA